MGKVEVSHLNKILYPKSKITKKEVLSYYSKVSARMLPFMKNRALALERCTENVSKGCFYQKNAGEYFPSWIKTRKIRGTNYVVCNDKDSLIYLANQDTIVFHQWLSQIDELNNPDVLVWDIDPAGEKDLKGAIEAVKSVKEVLDKLKLKSYLLSTGVEGFHIIVPIKKEISFKEARGFTKRISEIVVKENPKKFTIEQRIKKRRGRVFIDYLRNSKAQLKVVPYSLRTKELGTIAMPLSWGELKPGFNHDKYNIRTISRYLEKNPWKDYFRTKNSVKTLKI